MTIRRRLRRNSLKDILETFYFGSRRFSKELKIQQQFFKTKTIHYRKILLNLVISLIVIKFLL